MSRATVTKAMPVACSGAVVLKLQVVKELRVAVAVQAVLKEVSLQLRMALLKAVARPARLAAKELASEARTSEAVVMAAVALRRA